MTETTGISINGHQVTESGTVDMGSAGVQKLYHCEGCRQIATADSFNVGTRGCPALPESLNYLSICTDAVCHQHHDDSIAVRAARQYFHHARAIGMRIVAQNVSEHAIGPDGGQVADFQHGDGSRWRVVVDAKGRIAAEFVR